MSKEEKEYIENDYCECDFPVIRFDVKEYCSICQKDIKK